MVRERFPHQLTFIIVKLFIDMSLRNKIESLLFISTKPMSVKDLEKMIGAGRENIEKALGELQEKYNNDESGLWILENKKVKQKQYQMATSPDVRAVVEKFVKEEVTGELTRASLETLTIIAYRGPMTRPEMEQIRGVNCSQILRNLLIKGLVEVEERNKEPYYSVSLDFLKHLGVNKVDELPDYDKLHQHEGLEEFLDASNSLE